MKNDKAINEYWYKGAVQQSIDEPESLFFTISTDTPDTLTVTRAILKSDSEGQTVPVAVVGAHMKYDLLTITELFQKLRLNNDKYDYDVEEELDCTDNSVVCYVLDTEGYVVFAKEEDNIGKFIGQVDKMIGDAFTEDYPDYEAGKLRNWIQSIGFLSDKR